MSNERYFRERRPEEIPSARKSIRYFCSQCMGGTVNEVKLCTVTQCWLFPWKCGTPPDKKPKLTAEQRAKAIDTIRAYRFKQEE